MLKQIRENAGMARILFYILIVAFVGLYAVTGHDTSPPAGKIFGKKVTAGDFQKARKGAAIQMMMRYGELPRDAKIDDILDEEAWNRLILLHEAKSEHVKISDREIVDAIKGIPDFNDKGGRFSKKQYEEVLKYGLGLTPAEFESQTRDDLTMKKLLDKQTQDIKLSEEDVLREYKFLNEKAKADYILFKTADCLSQVTVTDEEVKAYFEKNKDNFRIPEKVNAEYISKAFADDKEETKQKTRNEMKEISYELAGNTDLAGAAKKFSLPVKETGLFDRSSNIPGIGYDIKLADAALSLAVGQVSNPIETKAGIYILKIKEKKPERQAEFAEVKDSVDKALKAEKADAIAKAKAQDALTAIKAAIEKKETFEAAAKGLNLSVKKVDALARGQYIEGLGIAPEFSEAVFSAKQGGVAENIARVHNGYVIARQDSILPIDDKKYQEEKDKFKETMLAQKKIYASITWFTELQKKANLQSNLEKLRGARR